ncbi:MAG: hypothetical protein E7254_07645 [Lachnospiraceae bacterium]|nr:hypothetical protein [Lachnospiraceae bacterium]
MAGWNQKLGDILSLRPSDDELWSRFNFVFSDASMKRNTYKFGLVKAILDNLLNSKQDLIGMYRISFPDLFGKFAENYWNLVVKYGLRQMRKNSNQSDYSALEQIFMKAVEDNPVLGKLQFSSIDENKKKEIIGEVSKQCRKNVIGALYGDLLGLVYGFDIQSGSKKEYIWISPIAYDFMFHYKGELEKLNYYSWARFLEKINNDSVLLRVIDKLESATPQRSNLDVFREILREEFEENTCFFCGSKFERVAHVDHFIPWSFVKEDRLWNFVLACSTCNTKKNNKIVSDRFFNKLVERNRRALGINNSFVKEQFDNYQPEFYRRIWMYAKMSGLKVYDFK